MEFNWSILGWIAGLVFVYLFGLFEGRGQGYKKRKAEEEQERMEQPAARQTAQPPAAAKPDTITIDDPGLLRLKDENGSFVLDLDGRRVNPISLSSDQRRRLIDMLNILRPWLEGRSMQAPASAPAQAVPLSPGLSRPATIADRLDAIGSPAPQSMPSSAPVTPPARESAQPP